jgi:hypothetical protein
MRYGTWTVIEDAGRRWLCVCDCGTTRRVIRSDLLAGRSRNCGCIRREKARNPVTRNAVRHGRTGTPEFTAWIEMRRRCRPSSRVDYPRWGGRGIQVCERWQLFENFYADMGDRPDGCTLDRIDNSGHYEPGNVRWATKREQARNRRTNRFVIVKGEPMTIAEAAERFGVPATTIQSRLRHNWSEEDAALRPVRIMRR